MIKAPSIVSVPIELPGAMCPPLFVTSPTTFILPASVASLLMMTLLVSVPFTASVPPLMVVPPPTTSCPVIERRPAPFLVNVPEPVRLPA